LPFDHHGCLQHAVKALWARSARLTFLGIGDSLGWPEIEHRLAICWPPIGQPVDVSRSADEDEFESTPTSHCTWPSRSSRPWTLTSAGVAVALARTTCPSSAPVVGSARINCAGIGARSGWAPLSWPLGLRNTFSSISRSFMNSLKLWP